MIRRHHFPTIDSTHSYAIEQAEELDDQWHLFTADRQTAGRGQYSRKWVSPADVNIYASFLIPFPLDKQLFISHTAQVAMLAILTALETEGFSPQLKWPNDLLLESRKVGGVLCENIQLLKKSRHSALIVSVGLNVNMSKEICDCIGQPVTSLAVQSEKQWDREELLKRLQVNIFTFIERLKTEGFTPFFKEFNEHLAYIGEKVHLELRDGKTIPGIFEGINTQGYLRLRLSNGEIQEFSTGLLIKNKELI